MVNMIAVSAVMSSSRHLTEVQRRKKLFLPAKRFFTPHRPLPSWRISSSLCFERLEFRMFSRAERSLLGRTGATPSIDLEPCMDDLKTEAAFLAVLATIPSALNWEGLRSVTLRRPVWGDEPEPLVQRTEVPAREITSPTRGHY